MRRGVQTLTKSLVLSLLLAGAASGASGQEPTPPLRFLGNAKLPPMIFVENGRPVGLVVDLAYAAAEKAHLAIRVEAMDWATAQALVAAGQGDALLQINPTPEREQLYDFSDTLLESNFQLLRRTKRIDIQSVASLYGKKVGVEQGAGFPIQFLQQYPQVEQVALPSWEAGFAMLRAGQIDAILVDRWVGEYELYLNKISDVTVVDPPLVTDYSRIAVKKGNRALLDRINAGLRAMEQDGTRQRILTKWRAKEVVYLPRETLERLALWAALAGVVLLGGIAWRARAHARAMRQLNRDLDARTQALTQENAERVRAEAALQQANETLEQRIGDRTAALQASEGRLRLFVEHAPAAIAMFDEQMRYLAVSRRWLADYGVGDQELLGRSHYEVFPEIPARWKRVHQQGLAGEVVRADEDRFDRHDGTQQWLRWEVRPWHTAAGRIGGIIIFTEDITARKQAEEARRASEERFRVLTENLQSAVALIDERGVFSIVNSAFRRLFHLPQDADILNVNSRDWAQWQVFDDRGVLLAADEHPVRKAALMRTEVKNQLVAVKSPSSQELKWLLVSAEPLLDARGGIHRLICTYYDITARKQAEEALRAKEAELREAQRVGHIGSWYWDAKTDVTIGSDELFRIYGLDPARGSFPNFRDQEGILYPQAAWQRLNSAVQETVRTGVGYELDVEALRNGTPIWITTRSEVVHDAGGRIVGLRGTVQDITPRKQAQINLQRTLAELERSNQELEQFAYVASHDLQEPLRMVSSFTQLLAERYQDRLDQPAQEFIAFAVDGATRMQRLIQDLLTYSRVTTRGEEMTPTDAQAALGEALASLQAAIQEAGAVVSQDALPTVRADATQLTQLFQNLIGNAIKFHGEAPPRVHVSATPRGEDWVFAVADNGIGIAPQYFERIFVIFQRLHPPHRYPGTGIGLALCQRIVQRHGGRLWVESTPGQGATFYFTMKRQEGLRP